MSETYAIARYAVRKAGKEELLGKTPADQALVENFIYAFSSTIFAKIMEICMNKKTEDIKMGEFFKLKGEFNKVEKFLQGKDYVIGYLTIADFYLAEYFHYIRLLYPNEYMAFKGMLNLQEKVESLPEVKAYYERKPHILTPFLPPAMTGIPLFWPGTEPKIPPPPSSPTKKMSKASSKQEEQQNKESPSQENKTQSQQKPEKQE